MSTTVSAYVGAAASARAATVLPLIQATVPSADLAYTYTAAVRVGLNRLAHVAPWRRYTPADFTPQVDPAATLVAIAVEADDGESGDVARADAIAAAQSTSRAVVISAAACTGLAMLAGIDTPISGPFAPS